MKPKAAGFGSISAVISSNVLLCVSSLIIIIIIIIIMITITIIIMIIIIILVIIIIIINFNVIAVGESVGRGAGLPFGTLKYVVYFVNFFEQSI